LPIPSDAEWFADNREKLGELSPLGAVGDIALRFFDVHGQPVAYDLANYVLSITMEQLKGVERVVGVSGGLRNDWPCAGRSKAD